MDKLQMIKAWLEGFPGWGGAEWEVDLNGNAQVSCRLTLEDEKCLRRTEDVLGGSRLSMQVQFCLIRLSYSEEDPGLWVDTFFDWVTRQSECGTAPGLGAGITRYRLEKGKLETDGYKAVYTVRLIGNYEKIFEVK